MMAKAGKTPNRKLSLNEFRATVTNMVKEAVAQAIVREGPFDALYASVKDLPAFKAWVFRKYFGPANKDKRWFDPNVTVDNVLDALVKPRSPISPRGAMEVWKAMPLIQKGLSAADAEKDLDTVAGMVGATDAGEEHDKYTKGDKTLKAMSKQLGDVTPAMVNKIFAGGAEKFKKLTGGISPEDMSDEDLVALGAQIDKAREETAVDFAKLLKASRGNTKKFLDALVKAQILTPGELGFLTDEEVGALTMLAGRTEDEIRGALLADINHDDNVFKTFQNAVSKRVFPPGKRGRPPGSKNKPRA